MRKEYIPASKEIECERTERDVPSELDVRYTCSITLALINCRSALPKCGRLVDISEEVVPQQRACTREH